MSRPIYIKNQKNSSSMINGSKTGFYAPLHFMMRITPSCGIRDSF